MVSTCCGWPFPPSIMHSQLNRSWHKIQPTMVNVKTLPSSGAYDTKLQFSNFQMIWMIDSKGVNETEHFK